MAIATFGAGCFWGVEAAFRRIEGVTDAAVGYAGGHTDHPTYRDWSLHDPTQFNRQGPDVGDQYRSVVFFHTPEQEAAAQTKKKELEASSTFNRPIVTVIEPVPTFWRAEDYHQRYLEKNRSAGCKLSGK